MTIEVRLGAHRIGGQNPVFLIGEIGSNHNRDMGLAKRLIDAAADAGMDAVKFQSFRADWLYPSNCGAVETPMGLVDFYEVLHDAQLPPDWLPELKRHADDCGLLFMSSPFDAEAVRALQHLGVAGLKIASPELNHLPLLRVAAETGLPLLCSTGICTISDIEEAIQTVRQTNPGSEIALFQCVSGYPTPEDQCNLGAIDTLRRAFGVPVGFSDHTMSWDLIPAVTTAVGGALIEKHFTLDRTLPGPDHPFALEPGELKAMAEIVRHYESIPRDARVGEAIRQFGEAPVRNGLGHGRKEIMPIEAEIYPCDKRSIHAIRAIAPGELLSQDNVRILRSERNLQPGLHSRNWETVLGARATQAIEAGQGVKWEHLLSR